MSVKLFNIKQYSMYSDISGIRVILVCLVSLAIILEPGWSTLNIVTVLCVYVVHILVSNCLLLNLQVVLVFILSIASLIIYFIDASRLVYLKISLIVILLKYTAVIQLSLSRSFQEISKQHTWIEVNGVYVHYP